MFHHSKVSNNQLEKGWASQTPIFWTWADGVMNAMSGAVQHALHAEGLWGRVEAAHQMEDDEEVEEEEEEEAGI